VAIVTRSHPTQGVVEVRIQNGFEMDELHNVSAQSPSNNQGLFYNTSTSLWENKSIATALGYTPADDSLVVKLAGTQTITGSKTFSSTALFDTTTLYKKIGSPYITSAGYTSLQFTASGTNTSLYITDGDSVTSNRLIFKNNAGYDYTFPAASGTIALTSDLTGYVTSVTASLPLSSSGGTTPAISIPVATSSANGYLSSTDWLTFNGKIGGGGTANYIPKFSGTFSIADSIIYDNSGNVLINTTDSSIGHRLAVYSTTEAAQLRVMGLAPSVLFTESTTNTNSYSAYLGVVTSVNNFYTGSFIGDFVMSNNSNYGIAFAINNSQKLRIANTGAATFASSVTATSFVKTSGTSSQYLMADGSVSTLTNPVTGTGTTNYLPKFTGTSTIGNSLVYDNGTNVGINTITPFAIAATNLSVNGASSAIQLGVAGVRNAQFYADGAEVRLYAVTNVPLRFGTNDTEGMRLFNDGNLLIQTGGTFTNNGYKLDVNGTGRFRVSGDRNLAIRFDSNITLSAQSDSGAPENLRMYADTFRIYTATTAAGLTERFTIANTGAATFSSSVTATTESTGSSLIQQWIYKSEPSNYKLQLNSVVSTGIVKYSFDLTNNTTAYANNLVLDRGNVGIGTSSPSQQLHISGADNKILIESTNFAALQLKSSTTRTFNIQSINTDSGALRIYDVTADAERMRITSDGNLLLGTTDNGSGAKLVFYSTTAAQQLKAAGTAPAITFTNTITSPTIGGVLGAATGANQFITGTASGDMVLANQFNTGALIFGTSNTERMRILVGGNVGIGFSATDVRLFIKSAGTGAGTYNLYTRNSANTDLFVVRDDGYINTGLAANSPYYYNTTYAPRSCALDLGGGIGYVVSTRESKGNIQSIKNIDFINQLNPVQFNYRKKNKDNTQFIDELYEDVYYGFIADEVEKVNKDLVFYDNLQDGTKKLSGVEYNSMIAILTKAIQEQQKQIEELKLKIK
jgi:hypothetical protein